MMDLENLASFDKDELCRSMCAFITKVKKLDGTNFSPKTLYDITICVQFHLERNGHVWKFLDDPAFKDFRFTLDNLMKMRCSQGLGNQVWGAHVITFEDEDILWSNGILGTSNPQQLLETIFYLLGIGCTLCAGKEQRNWRSIGRNSQFSFQCNDDGKWYLLYHEDSGLKTNKGGLKHKKFMPKSVSVQHLVRIFEMYMNKLPIDRLCNALYLQPLHNYSEDRWYKDCPVGVNKLQKTVKSVWTWWSERVLFKPFTQSYISYTYV